MNDLLQNIETIFKDKGYLSFHGKNYYNIPLYQRGYKWTTKQVLKLLDDIEKLSRLKNNQTELHSKLEFLTPAILENVFQLERLGTEK